VALCLFLLIFRFFADFHELAIRLATLTWHELIVGVLNMIDIVLTANLVLIVIFSGYENFIRRVVRKQGCRETMRTSQSGH